jgi:hypothetical protein
MHPTVDVKLLGFQLWTHHSFTCRPIFFCSVTVYFSVNAGICIGSPCEPKTCDKTKVPDLVFQGRGSGEKLNYLVSFVFT